MPETTMADRLDLWKAEHSISSKLDPEHLAHIADRFSLDRTGIRTVSDIVGAHANEGEAVDFGTVWNACRLQARRGLDDLAERIVSQAGWNDLVLPDDQLRQLKEIAAHVRRSHQVHHQWGWAQRGGSGLGITALFAGPSGTGKTMAAEVLANELDIDLYRIDLSQIVSKYIGETEKNLRRIFEAAEHGGAMLVFEEADSMFGKRSDVKDSHDRYANLEVSYLLQRMESYKGLAILTTNLKGALDIAFMRRLRFVIAFPFPDQAQRAEIWRRVFPKQTPMGDCNPAQMARLSIAGGAIRTIAVNAAFMAAEDGSPVELRHLSAAARREYAKLEKPITAAEFGGLL
jgi:SpoVK/Ycf46/Vps4 family AAA+-type ATPase